VPKQTSSWQGGLAISQAEQFELSTFQQQLIDFEQPGYEESKEN
jgi:hypothetical protein